MVRHLPLTRDQLADAVLRSPLIHDLGVQLEALQPRRRRHPLALHLAWGALARAWRSANRLDAAVTNGSWRGMLGTFNAVAAERGERTVAPYLPPLTSDTYRHARDFLTNEKTLDVLLDGFTFGSVELAQELGLIRPDGAGSRTRPAPARTIYGDGTILRPLYRKEIGERADPDADEHFRFDGAHWGNNLVCVSVRGPAIHQRVVLAVGRVDAPGNEARTAVELIRRVHLHAGDGIQAVVYDGAFRGPHHETLMTDLGLIVVNKVHPATRSEDDTRTWRVLPLGNWTHQIAGRDCMHLLVVHNGAVHDSTMDDAGEPVLSAPCERRQVRRYPRGRRGGYRFSLGVTVPCPKESFTAWISPHPQGGDVTHRRPDQLRLLPPADPYFQTLYGLRNDSEAINSEYKRTLPWDRAVARGWRRQVLDIVSWALLNNARAWKVHQPR